MEGMEATAAEGVQGLTIATEAMEGKAVTAGQAETAAGEAY